MTGEVGGKRTHTRLYFAYGEDDYIGIHKVCYLKENVKADVKMVLEETKKRGVKIDRISYEKPVKHGLKEVVVWPAPPPPSKGK